MSFQYKNRRGDVYHLQSKRRRGGAEGFSFTRKPTGILVDSLPEGYEVYELPDNAQVVLRKIKPSEILATEKQMAETALRHTAKLKHFIVEVDGNGLVIWLADSDPVEAMERIARGLGMGGWGLQGLQEDLIRDTRYTRMMRFVLTDPTKRQFDVERWCFRGRIDGWHHLDFGKPLAALLKKYVPHLGKESFYDLM